MQLIYIFQNTNFKKDFLNNIFIYAEFGSLICKYNKFKLRYVKYYKQT